VKAIPLGRVAETHELSDVITFLATSAAGYVNREPGSVDSARPQVDQRARTRRGRRDRNLRRLAPRLERGPTQELDAWFAADLVGVWIHARERLAPAARTDREHQATG
jgi:hypothetical protein